MRSFCLVLLTAVAASGLPQDKASTSDIVAKAAGSSYGQDRGSVDNGVLAEVFGTSYVTPSGNKQSNEKYGAPAGQVTDDRYSNCSYYKQEGYECVPYYLCRDGYIITDGAGVIDIRSGFKDVKLDAENSKCKSYLEVCCRSEDFIGQPPPTRPPIVVTPEPTTSAPFVNKCGRRNTGGVGVRIQNERDGGTQFGEWPHMCAVLRNTRVGGKDVNLYVCGASLIAPGIAMTAAHCVEKFNQTELKVRCGEWDTQQTIEPVEHQDRYAKHVSIHPTFNGGNLKDDFALIHLESEFVLSAHIDTICLPSQDTYYDQHLNEDCVATGWGKDKFGKHGEYQVILKQVEMDVVERDECVDRLRETRLGRRFNLDESFMCAGGQPDQDTCKGDGGGPLVCPTKRYVSDSQQQYVQAGIVAWGIKCGENVPGVYANVSTALCFIDWATRCVEGQNADYYGISGCRKWAKRSYCEYKEKIADLQYQEDRSVDLRSRGRHARQRFKYEKLLAPLEASIQGCQTGPKDLDCNYYDYLESDDFDLSGHARAQEEDEQDEDDVLSAGPRSAPAVDAK